MERTIKIRSKENLQNRVKNFLSRSEDWAILSLIGFTVSDPLVTISNETSFIQSLTNLSSSTYISLSLDYTFYDTDPVRAGIFLLSVYCLLVFLYLYAKENSPLTISMENESEEGGSGSR